MASSDEGSTGFNQRGIDIDLLLNRLAKVMAMAGSIVAMVGTIFAVLHYWRQPRCEMLPSILARQMVEPYFFPKIKETVNRTKLFEDLHHSVKNFPLTVVLGQRQSGKSTLVDTYLAGRRNVYKHAPNGGFILGEDRARLCGDGAISEGQLTEALRQATETNGQRALVVLEVRHDAKADLATNIYEDLKTIVVDMHLPDVRGILVLSNHFLLTSLPRDSGRYNIVWVGDLQKKEAEALLHRWTDMDPSTVINETGYHVSQLVKCAQLGSIEAWQDRVTKQVTAAVRMQTARIFMDNLPKGGANFDMLLAMSPHMPRKMATMLTGLQEQTYPVVLYNAGLDWFHWASPFHYEAFQRVKETLPRDEL